MDEEARKKFEREVARQKASGVPLREQFLWRIEALTNAQELPLSEHLDDFPELRRGFEIPNTRLGLAPSPPSEASLEDGGSILVAGFLHTGNDQIAHFQRRLLLDQEIAIHERLTVVEQHRGNGISLAMLLRSFELYDALSIREVRLEAGYATGRWHWGRVGFEFARDADCAAVREWAVRVSQAMGWASLRVESFTSATQFALMGGGREVSLGDMREALPEHGERIELAAKNNNLTLEEGIEFGRAVMITGPSWHGVLDLQGPSRVQLETYAAAKAERMGGVSGG